MSNFHGCTTDRSPKLSSRPERDSFTVPRSGETRVKCSARAAGKSLPIIHA